MNILAPKGQSMVPQPRKLKEDDQGLAATNLT